MAEAYVQLWTSNSSYDYDNDMMNIKSTNPDQIQQSNVFDSNKEQHLPL